MRDLAQQIDDELTEQFDGTGLYCIYYAPLEIISVVDSLQAQHWMLDKTNAQLLIDLFKSFAYENQGINYEYDQIIIFLDKFAAKGEKI